jgi:hypothetical protein
VGLGGLIAYSAQITDRFQHSFCAPLGGIALHLCLGCGPAAGLGRGLARVGHARMRAPFAIGIEVDDAIGIAEQTDI